MMELGLKPQVFTVLIEQDEDGYRSRSHARQRNAC